MRVTVKGYPKFDEVVQDGQTKLREWIDAIAVIRH